MRTKAIQHRDITRGASFDSMNTYNANIVPGVYIQIFGTYRNHVKGPQEFHRVFTLGSEAEYDSYNLKYTGKIVGIGPQTVTIEAYSGTCNATRHRLSLSKFCWRNWDFDSAKTAAYNSEEMMHI